MFFKGPLLVNKYTTFKLVALIVEPGSYFIYLLSETHF